MTTADTTIAWLLDSDPAIRWHVMRDLQGRPEGDWWPERAKIETEGWGAELLSHQDVDGQWAGGSFFPTGFTEQMWHDEGQPWTATTYAFTQLREFGIDPTTERMRHTVELVGANSRWDEGNQPFWQGEVEECINGRTIADGSYFGVDMSELVARLVTEVQSDGGWNCERAEGSVKSSFHSTINVLEGLLEFEKATGGTNESRAARASGEEYLLKRGLFRRLSTGEPADENYLTFTHPNQWCYDVLRALDYFRAAGLHAGTSPDQRLADAVDFVRSRQDSDGTWSLDRVLRGRTWFNLEEGAGRPSRWITLRSLRVLSWWNSARP